MQSPEATGKSYGAKHFASAFKYSISGLRHALREAAFRQELALAALHAVALAILRPRMAAALVLSALLGVVLVAELLNTAIEAVVDLASPGRNALAGKAKDLGSAAVFVSLVLFGCAWTAVLVWR